MPRPADPRAREAPGLGWRATLACGLLLGCAIVFLEAVQQPIATVRFADIGTFFANSGPIWCCSGVVWSVFARAAEPHLGRVGLIIATITAALVISAVALVFDHGWAIGGAETPLEGFASHVLWTNAFYGGLYVAAYAGWRRSVRSRRALALVLQARDESAALLEQSRLDSFLGVLHPQTVVHSVDALRGLYRQDAVRGDVLLDLFVGFLRPAVRSLKTNSARLRDELDLARRYLQLRASTAGAVGEITIADAPRAPDIIFPPRLLTPVLDALSLAGGRVGLDAGWRDGAFRLRVLGDGADSAALSPQLRRRMAAAADQPGVTGRLTDEPRGLVWTLSFDPQHTPRTDLSAIGALP